MFWGIMLESGKKKTQHLKHSLHITMASLGLENLGSNDPVSVILEINRSQFVLCSLRADTYPQQILNLNFTHGEHVSFFIEGAGVAYLTGLYLLPDPKKIVIQCGGVYCNGVMQGGSPKVENSQNAEVKSDAGNLNGTKIETCNGSKSELFCDDTDEVNVNTPLETHYPDGYCEEKTIPYSESLEMSWSDPSLLSNDTDTRRKTRSVIRETESQKKIAIEFEKLMNNSYINTSGASASENDTSVTKADSLTNGQQQSGTTSSERRSKNRLSSERRHNVTESITVKSTNNFYHRTSTPGNNKTTPKKTPIRTPSKNTKEKILESESSSVKRSRGRPPKVNSRGSLFTKVRTSSSSAISLSTNMKAKKMRKEMAKWKAQPSGGTFNAYVSSKLRRRTNDHKDTNDSSCCSSQPNSSSTKLVFPEFTKLNASPSKSLELLNKSLETSYYASPLKSLKGVDGLTYIRDRRRSYKHRRCKPTTASRDNRKSSKEVD